MRITLEWNFGVAVLGLSIIRLQGIFAVLMIMMVFVLEVFFIAQSTIIFAIATVSDTDVVNTAGSLTVKVAVLSVESVTSSEMVVFSIRLVIVAMLVLLSTDMRTKSSAASSSV